MSMTDDSSIRAESAIRAASEDIAIAMTRPHVLMRPSISIDGYQWCALYGENLQDGVAGFGDSPDKAMRDFDANWLKGMNQRGGDRG